jgi:cell division transport system permease protein
MILPSALPLGPSRLLTWVVALLVYAAGLGGIGCLVVDDAVRASDAQLATSWNVQLPADASTARLETVLALLRQTSGIASVRLLDPTETARLLEPWLGPAVPADELPLPRLIDLRVAPGGVPDVAGLRRQLASIVPEVRLDDHLPWPPGMRAAARRTEGVLAAVVVLALLLVAAAGVAAAHAVTIAGRSTAALLHALGASDADIARHLGLRAARGALAGGAIGAGAAVLTLAALGGAGAVVNLPAPPAASGIVGWRLWAILAGIVVAAGLLALAGSELAMRRRLARRP